MAEPIAPVPSGVDDLRRIFSERFDQLLAEADLLDEDDHLAVLALFEDLHAEVVGPELARRDAEIKRVTALFADRATRFVGFADQVATALGLDLLETSLDELPAKVAELRAYAETTRYHQQKHAEAVREMEKLRAERDRLAAEVQQLRRAQQESRDSWEIFLDHITSALATRPALHDRNGRIWLPTHDDQYVLPDPDDPDNPGWLRPDIDREFGPVTEVPAERGETT